MLSEIVVLSAEGRARGGKEHETRNGISCSGVFPCPHYIYRAFKRTLPQREVDGSSQLNMENGWWQEEESIKLLGQSGIEVFHRQERVEIGQSKVPGKIDGEVNFNKEVILWEHKAWDTRKTNLFKQKGLSAFPWEKSQVNLYMHGRKLEKCDFYVKGKEHNEPYDHVVPYEKDFALSLIGWLDEVILGGWEPQPMECEYCSHCGLSFECWGAEIIDLAGLRQMSDEELSKKFKLGKQYKDFSDWILEEVRAEMVMRFDKQGLGVGDTLLIDDVKVQKMKREVWRLDKRLLVEKLGPTALIEVGQEKEEFSYRIQEVMS